MKNKTYQILTMLNKRQTPIIKQVIDWKLLLSTLLFFSTIQLTQIIAQDNADKQIQKAYELRMKGDTDSAIKMIDEIIEKNPSNALAFFEMARIKPNDNIDLLQKAFDLDPQNPMYGFELANANMLKAYIALMQGKEEESKEPLQQCMDNLKKVLKIKPECKESLMFLIELNLFFDDLRNNDDLAIFMRNLKNIDPVYATQAEIVKKGAEVNAVEYWQKFMDENGKTPEILIRMGMASLNMGNTEKAETIFEEVLNADPERNDLYLQLARGHLYKAMQADQETAKKEMGLIKKYINIYLEKEDNKVNHLEAWCYGWLSMVERRSGNNEMAQTYLDKANKLDPNFSRATALPELTADSPPNEITYKYRSYFTPF